MSTLAKNPPPDRRLNAYRPDLADAALEGVVQAERFTEGSAARIGLPIVPARLSPDRVKPRDTEFLLGEPITVFDRGDGWAWVQSRRDGYVGYIDLNAVQFGAPAPTHRVCAIRSQLYPAPDLKRFALSAVPFGALVRVVDRNERWAQIADGQWIYADHLALLDDYDANPVDVALRFLETPYLWGGRSSEGMDCSALIQFALEACGIPCPRDTDMQERQLGRIIAIDEDAMKAGDLAFWPGHVGIMIDSERVLHCNATDMATRVWTLENLRAHILRIEKSELRTVRRL